MVCDPSLQVLFDVRPTASYAAAVSSAAISTHGYRHARLEF
jgi:hypothetical protein